MSIPTIRLSSHRRPRAAKAAKPKRSGVVPLMPAHHPPYKGGAATAIFNGPGFPSAANTTVSFGGYPILMHAHVALIFYGSAWKDQAPNPSAVAIQDAIQTVLDSPYCSQLLDYECTGGDMNTAWNVIVLDDPPSTVSQDDAEDLVEDLVDSFYSTFPFNNRPTFYAVFLPPGVTVDTPINGEHSNDGGLYFSYQLFGTLDFITQVFTHELVEALTDPDGNGWQVDPRNGTNWNEIADICKNASARVNGVSVAAYYSTSIGACVVPQPDPPPPPPPQLPDGEYRITNGFFAYHKGSRYLAIIGGSHNGQPWLMHVDHAVQRVQNGQLKFYTLEGGHKANVVIGTSETNHQFLTTTPDSTKVNNLDVIAEVNPSKLPDDGVFWE